MSSPPKDIPAKDADLAGSRRVRQSGFEWKRWLASPEASVVFVILALLVWVAASGRMQQFGGTSNQSNLARSIGMSGVLAIGSLLVILTGGIDLSVGSLVAFAGMLMAVVAVKLADSGMSIPLATFWGIVAALGFSLLLGVIHAALIQYLQLPPFVVTLASMSILRSGSYLLNNTLPMPIDRFPLVYILGNKPLYFANLPIAFPIPAVILGVVAVITMAILAYTKIGRRVYSVGSNEQASRLSGVNVFAVKLFAYGACSLLAGLGGILYSGYWGQGDPQGGVMFELNAISAAVIGGAALTGGQGSVIGTVLGTILLEWILNMINLIVPNSTLWRGLVVGGVLMAAVVLNQIRRMDLVGAFRRKYAKG